MGLRPSQLRQSGFNPLWRGKALRFVRFGIVGALGSVINEGLLSLLYGRVHLPLIVASAIAIECAIVSNYLCNDRWTFHHPTPSFSRFRRFNAVSLLSLVVNIGVLTLLSSRAHVDYRAANFIGIVVAFGVNYVLNVYWTYGKALAEPESGASEDCHEGTRAPA